jgi:hypothetical protein
MEDEIGSAGTEPGSGKRSKNSLPILAVIVDGPGFCAFAVFVRIASFL